MPAPTMVDKHVKVNKHAVADPYSLDIYKTKHERAVWDPEEATKIAFEYPEGSPFGWMEKDIPAGHSFGDHVRDDAPEGKYRYAVYAGGERNDPAVIVHN